MILRLLNTTVFRLSLVYALLFSAVVAVAMGSIYWGAAAQLVLQADTRLRLESKALEDLLRTGSVNTLRETIKLRNEDSRRAGRRFFIYGLTNSQTPVFDEYVRLDMPADSKAKASQAFGTASFSSLLRAIDQPVSVPQGEDKARVLITTSPDGWQLLAAADMSDQEELLNTLYRNIVLAIFIIFALAILGGVLMGYGVLRRIDSVRKTADSIINGDLTQRMTVTNRNDEFDRLSVVLNSMLQRIEQLMQAMREVTDNLAHDLRNPLNRLRNRLEASRFHTLDEDSQQSLLQDALQDVDDLIKTFNALLGIAQAESGVHRDDWSDVRVDKLIADLGELYEVVAEEQGIQFSYHSEIGLQVYGNRQLLAQALTNLLDNAVKYTPEGGQISLHAQAQNHLVAVSISDTGPGIPPEQGERVFERFVRLDNARSTPGNGLGLSLVKAVADMHAAQIKLEDKQPGLRVVLLFQATA
ncbi:MAG: two-component sensor histidine kinase [Proteobacteria bacterium]|nr:MAG: two-component sensor histidine kinase [Pseudomonadota bacterium]